LSSYNAVNKDSSLLARYAVFNVQEKFCCDSLDPEDTATDFSEMAVLANCPCLI